VPRAPPRPRASSGAFARWSGALCARRPPPIATAYRDVLHRRSACASSRLQPTASKRCGPLTSFRCLAAPLLHSPYYSVQIPPKSVDLSRCDAAGNAATSQIRPGSRCCAAAPFAIARAVCKHRAAPVQARTRADAKTLVFFFFAAFGRARRGVVWVRVGGRPALFFLFAGPTAAATATVAPLPPVSTRGLWRACGGALPRSAALCRILPHSAVLCRSPPCSAVLRPVPPFAARLDGGVTRPVVHTGFNRPVGVQPRTAPEAAQGRAGRQAVPGGLAGCCASGGARDMRPAVG